MIVSRLVSVVISFAISVAATQSSAAAPEEQTESSGQPRSVRVISTVVSTNSAPISNAVVVSSLGGKGVTDERGSVGFDVALDSAVEEFQVTAVGIVGGMSAVATVRVRIPDLGSEIDTGVMALQVAGSCEPSWLPTFGVPAGMNAMVRAMTVFDDGLGDGPALYVGGDFGLVNNLDIDGVARWDGFKWSSVGTGTGAVYALTVFDDGRGEGPALYAGGSLTAAGGVSVNRIAKWNGSRWSALGSGVSGTSSPMVRTLEVFDDGLGGGPMLYVGGDFTSAGGASAIYVARWNGATWSPVGGGMNNVVLDFAAFDDGSGLGPQLYATGTFTKAGGITVNGIAKWNGTTWSTVGGGVSNYGTSLAVWDDGAGPRLYVGGVFTSAGLVNVSNIAAWNGSAWATVGSGTSGSIRTLTVFDDGNGDGPALFVGGTFSNAGGNPAKRVARWNGSDWSAVGDGVNDGALVILGFDDGSGDGPKLFVGGDFDETGSGLAVNNLAVWGGGDKLDGISKGIAGDASQPYVSALTVFDDGSGDGPALFAAGDFSSAGGEVVNHIAKWNGQVWTPLGSGMNSTVNALATYDDGSGDGDALYAGGAFTNAGGVGANRVARWNGSTWTSLGSGVGGSGTVQVHSLCVFDDQSGNGPALFVGGRFAQAGGAGANHIAKWNGLSWSPLGSGVGTGTTAQVSAMTVFDDGLGQGTALYVGGTFTTAGGTGAPRIARWNGSTWSPVGSGLSGLSSPDVFDLAVFDDGTTGGPALYAVGRFNAAGAVSVPSIARWDGTNWSSVGDGVNANAYALTVFDDGTGGGPALFVGGGFKIAGSVTVNHVAKWNGLEWSALGEGTGGDVPVRALQVFDMGLGQGPALFVGGFFRNSPAGDSYLARWQGCAGESQCDLADVNCDGSIDGNDIGLILGNWGQCVGPAGCIGDLNGDGWVNAADLGVVLDHWTGTQLGHSGVIGTLHGATEGSWLPESAAD